MTDRPTATSEGTRATVLRVLSEVLDRAPGTLGPHTPLSALITQDAEYRDMEAGLQSATGVILSELEPYEPIPTAGEATLMSLRNLAPLSAGAARYLQLCDPGIPEFTPASLAASIDAKRVMPSGMTSGPFAPPRSLRYVLGWSFASLQVPPLAAQILPCGVLSDTCPRTVDVRVEQAMAALWLSSAILALAYLPGIVALWRRSRRVAWRRRLFET